MALRLTRRALADLDLDVQALAGRQAEELVGSHPVIAAFVERRSQNPEGQEAIQLPASRAIVYSLHAGRWRPLTWWEQELGIVWLLGAGYHRSGKRSDAYATLKRRDEADELFPPSRTTNLEPDPSDYVKAVARDAPDLVAIARHAPGDEVRGDLAGVLDGSVLAVVVEDAGHLSTFGGLLDAPEGSDPAPSGVAPRCSGRPLP